MGIYEFGQDFLDTGFRQYDGFGRRRVTSTLNSYEPGRTVSPENRN